MHQQIDYVDIIRSHGFRVTPQRLLILDAVCEGKGHTTLGEIYARVRSADPSVDRSTVYRALDLFLELGLVVSADLGDGETVYEVTKPRPHHHLVCQHCGEVNELSNQVMQALIELVAVEHQFAVNMDHHLVVFGICSRCRAAGVSQMELPCTRLS